MTGVQTVSYPVAKVTATAELRDRQNVNTTKSKQVGFRLSIEQERELLRAANDQGKSSGLYARDVVIAHLMGFTPFDEVNHRLGALERSMTGLARELDGVRGLLMSSAGDPDELGSLRAALATAAFRLLTEMGDVDSEDAASWVTSTFGVREE